MESTAVRSWRPALACLVMIVLLGCEGRPQLSMVKNPLPDSSLEPESAIRSDSETYAWPFTIEPPSSFECFQRKPEISTDPFAGEPIYTTFPDELASDVKLTLQKLVDSEALREVPLPVPVSDEIASRGFELSPDGTNLATIGSKVQIWNIATRRKLSFVGPENPIRVFFDDSPSGVRSRSITVASKSAVEKFELPGGQSLAKWNAPEPIVRISASRDRRTFAIVTESGHLLALNSDLQQVAECSSAPVSNFNVSVHPTGKWVAACSSDGPVRWNLAENARHYYSLDAEDFDHERAFSVSTLGTDFWIGPDLIHAFKLNTQIVPLPESSKRNRDSFLVLAEIKFAEACRVADREWLLCIARQPTRDGTIGWKLFDVDVASPVPFSAPVTLPAKPEDFSSSRDGSIVAVSGSERIRVYERITWIDPYGDSTIKRLSELAREGRYEQCELAANWLREQSVFRFRQTGENLFAQLAATIGTQWHIAAPQENASRLQEFEDWSASKSVLAKSVSCVFAFRELDILVNRVAKMQSMIDLGSTPEDAAIEMMTEVEQLEAQISQHTDSLWNEVDELLAADQAPMIAFHLKVALAAYFDLPFDELQFNLGQLLELYPFEASPHREAFSFLARNSETEARAYLSTYSKCFPAELQEQAYATCLLGSGGVLDPLQSTSESLSFNETLAVNGFDGLTRGNKVGPNEIRSAVRFVLSFRAVSPMLLDYMVKNFPLLPSNMYDAKTQVHGGFADSLEAKRKAFDFAR